MHSLGVAEELCGRTSRKGGTLRSRTNDGGRKRWRMQWGGEKREAWNMVECFRDRGEQPPNGFNNEPVWPEEEGSHEGAGQSTEEYGRRTVPKLDEDGDKKIIFKMARDRTF